MGDIFEGDMLIKVNVPVTCGNDAMVITLLLHPNVNPVLLSISISQAAPSASSSA